MDMFVLVVAGFDLQAGEIDTLPAGDGYLEGAALWTGGIRFADLKLSPAGRTLGGSGSGNEFQRCAFGNGSGGQAVPVELDRLCRKIRKSPNGDFNARNPPGIGFPGVDEYVVEKVFGQSAFVHSFLNDKDLSE